MCNLLWNQTHNTRTHTQRLLHWSPRAHTHTRARPRAVQTHRHARTHTRARAHTQRHKHTQTHGTPRTSRPPAQPLNRSANQSLAPERAHRPRPPGLGGGTGGRQLPWLPGMGLGKGVTAAKEGRWGLVHPFVCRAIPPRPTLPATRHSASCGRCRVQLHCGVGLREVRFPGCAHRASTSAKPQAPRLHPDPCTQGSTASPSTPRVTRACLGFRSRRLLGCNLRFHLPGLGSRERQSAAVVSRGKGEWAEPSAPADLPHPGCSVALNLSKVVRYPGS